MQHIWSRRQSFRIENRYLMLPTGELIIREVKTADTFRGYRCQVHNILTGSSDMSATAGKVIITGE
ncbi:unnamed protein product, partial [Ixodes persulcatus]